MVGTDSLLRDRYRLGEKIATGGMGSVYVATDERLGRDVAVKVLAHDLASEDSFVERFRREARGVASLSHPNIAAVFDYGQDAGCHFIVMELAEGRDLARALREDGPLEPERAVPILIQICHALGHAHAAGIVHRDVKPANVIVADDGRVKVTDFGIARAAGESKLTRTGSMLGTAHYVSPEQAKGEPLTARSDIYSIGIVTYELLTGAVPFTGDSLMSVAMRHLNEEVPPPSTVDPDIPRALDEVVQRATRKDPADRFRDTDDMALSLQGVLDTAPGAPAVAAAGTTAVLESADQTDQTVWPIPGTRWDPRSLGRAVIAVFAVLALITLGLVLWRLGQPAADTAAGEPAAEAPEAQDEDPGAGSFQVPHGVIGAPYKEVEDALEGRGFIVEVDKLKDDELLAFITAEGIAPEDAEKDEVVGTSPPPGEAVEPGSTITLLVSDGVDDDDDDDDDDDMGKGPPPGKGKSKDKDDD